MEDVMRFGRKQRVLFLYLSLIFVSCFQICLFVLIWDILLMKIKNSSWSCPIKMTKRGDIFIHISDSLCCTVESNTAL